MRIADWGRNMRDRRARRWFRPAAFAACTLLFWTSDVVRAEGEGGLYLGDLGQMIAAIVVFILLFLVLRRWAWGPIITQLGAREETIAQSLKQAERRERESEELLDEYRGQMDQAHAEARRLLDAAKDQAAEMKEDILSSARKEAHRTVRLARHEIAQAREEALQNLRETTARLAMEIAEKVIAKSLDPADHSRLMRESMDYISERGSEEL